MYQVECPCGRETSVQAPQAGSFVTCACGQSIAVPSLSILKRAAAEGAAARTDARTASTPCELGGGLPEKLCVHLCGHVGPDGNVASSSMNNYAGRVVGRIDDNLAKRKPDEKFELLIACAIMPEGRKHCEVEFLGVPSSPSLTDWGTELKTLIDRVPVPYVEAGPVAFAYYQRRNLPASSQSVAPFHSLQTSIKQHGMEMALLNRVGIATTKAETSELAAPTIWLRWQRWLASFSGRRPEAVISESRFEQLRTWLVHIENTAESSKLWELKQSAIADSDNVACHAILGVKFAHMSQWEAAIRSYSVALRLAPDTPCLLGRRADAQVQLGNTAAALKDYNLAIGLDPHDAVLRQGRADVFVALEAWQPAQEDLDAALRARPRDPGLFYKRSQTHWVRDQVDQAVTDMRHALRLDPNCGYVHLMLGWHGLQSATDNENAMWHLSEAVELLPDDSRPRLYRSSANLAQNKGALALEDCEQVLARDPNNAGAHGLHGRILHHENEYAAAIDACTRAIDLGLEYAPVYVIRALCYFATERPREAAEDCDAAQAIDPDDVMAKNLEGHLSLEAGDAQAALAAFESVSRMAPQWIEPRQNLAWVHRLLENPQAAIAEQTKLIAEQPSDPANYVNRAFALIQMHDFERAADDYAQALVHDPDNQEILAFRGTFYLDRQQYELALADFDRALTLNKDNDSVRLQRAYVYSALARYSEAAGDYALLIEKYPRDTRAYTGRAHALQMSGDNSAAQDDVARLSEIAPEHADTHAHQLLTSRIIQARHQYDYQTAMELAEQLIATAPEESIGYRCRACLNWDQELLVEALDDYSRLLDEQPDNAELISIRGQLLAEMGEWENAIVQLDRAIELCRRDGITLTLACALRGRNEALSGLQRHDEALMDYEESLRHCPTNPWIYYQRGLQLFAAQKFQEARALLELALELSDPHLPTRKRQRAQLAIKKCITD